METVSDLQIADAISLASEGMTAAEGDHPLISPGDHSHAQGGTNCLRVIHVGDSIC